MAKLLCGLTVVVLWLIFTLSVPAADAQPGRPDVSTRFSFENVAQGEYLSIRMLEKGQHALIYRPLGFPLSIVTWQIPHNDHAGIMPEGWGVYGLSHQHPARPTFRDQPDDEIRIEFDPPVREVAIDLTREGFTGQRHRWEMSCFGRKPSVLLGTHQAFWDGRRQKSPQRRTLKVELNKGDTPSIAYCSIVADAWFDELIVR